jgi:hypothetical protein
MLTQEQIKQRIEQLELLKEQGQGKETFSYLCTLEAKIQWLESCDEDEYDDDIENEFSYWLQEHLNDYAAQEIKESYEAGKIQESSYSWMAYALYGHDNMDWEQVISKFC